MRLGAVMDEKLNRRAWAASVAGLMLVCGAGGALVGGQMAEANNQSQSERTRQAPAQTHPVKHEFSVNDRGLTYGATAEDGTDPDLILAEANNGLLGYVYREDLMGPAYMSPQEAYAAIRQNAGEARVINVYKTDGVTVIGEFILTPGTETTE